MPVRLKKKFDKIFDNVDPRASEKMKNQSIIKALYSDDKYVDLLEKDPASFIDKVNILFPGYKDKVISNANATKKKFKETEIYKEFTDMEKIQWIMEQLKFFATSALGEFSRDNQIVKSRMELQEEKDLMKQRNLDQIEKEGIERKRQRDELTLRNIQKSAPLNMYELISNYSGGRRKGSKWKSKKNSKRKVKNRRSKSKSKRKSKRSKKGKRCNHKSRH